MVRVCFLRAGSNILAWTADRASAGGHAGRANEEGEHVVFVALVGDSWIGNWNYGL